MQETTVLNLKKQIQLSSVFTQRYIEVRKELGGADVTRCAQGMRRRGNAPPSRHKDTPTTIRADSAD